MRQMLFLLVFCSLILFGCLKIESKGDAPSPTPEVIYVNVTSSPQVIVTVQLTYVPTVTEKIVRPSVTSVPILKPVGGVEELGERKEYVAFDISKAANADYGHNPFQLGNSIGDSLYSGLKEGELMLDEVPYKILPPYSSGGKWNVITTASEEFFSANFLTGRDRFSEIRLLSMGSFIQGDRKTLAEIWVNYANGEIQKERAISNENVWNYGGDPNFPIPTSVPKWQKDPEGLQKLTAIAIPILRPLDPLGGITIRKIGANDEGFTIFAATGIKKFQSKLITQTQTEFQESEYDREFSTTLPEGATINYAVESGKRVYRPKGTFTSPMFDGETELVDWKRIEWNAIIPAGTGMKVLARTGPTSNGLFSEWVEIANGDDMPKDERFLQWKAEFETSDSSITPILKEMRILFENPA
ncbi:MAG: hypothetical protein ABIG96_05295 [Candidatus Micrarchaeota archaeon]